MMIREDAVPPITGKLKFFFESRHFSAFFTASGLAELTVRFCTKLTSQNLYCYYVTKTRPDKFRFGLTKITRELLSLWTVQDSWEQVNLVKDILYTVFHVTKTGVKLFTFFSQV